MKQRASANAKILMSTGDIFKLGYTVSMLAGESDTAEVMLYGEIVGDVPSYWNYLYPEDKNASLFKKEIDKVRNDGASKLLLRINSPGGVCTEATAMRSILGNAGFSEINIRIEGMCASAATTIATIPGAHVAITEGSEYMIHNPWCRACGTANDFEHTAERMRNIEKTSRTFYAKRTGQSDEQIKDWMDAETWFTAEEAVKYGFADEVLSAGSSNETPVVACVSSRTMNVMKAMYKTVPTHITVVDDTSPTPQNTSNHVSTGTPVAGDPSEIKNHEKYEEEKNMELKDLTLEQLRAENPALFQSVQQSAVDDERTRIEEIDALTMPGYEEMAAQAKADGTSSVDFQKQIITAMKEKGKAFIENRTAETNPSKQVTGGEPGVGQTDEDKEIQSMAKDVAEYAKGYNTGFNGNSMF